MARGIQHIRYSYDDAAYWGVAHLLRDQPPETRLVRRHLMGAAVAITPQLFPMVARELGEIGPALGITQDIECFVLADASMQALCVPHAEGADMNLSVVLSSALIERLSGTELRFVVGHEIGHYVFQHWRYPREDSGSAIDHLITLRLSRCAEISADRVGLMACDSLEAAGGAMIKTASGLSQPHLRVDLSQMLQQFRQLTALNGDESTVWISHPIIPLRLRALVRFDSIRRAVQKGHSWSMRELKRIDESIHADFRKSSGFVLDRITEENLQNVQTWGLVALFCADGVLTRKEQRLMIEVLGEERSRKVMGYLKNLGGRLVSSVGRRLAEACRGARVAPVEDRRKMIAQFGQLLAECGTTDVRSFQLLREIADAMGIKKEGNKFGPGDD